MLLRKDKKHSVFYYLITYILESIYTSTYKHTCTRNVYTYTHVIYTAYTCIICNIINNKIIENEIRHNKK